MNDEQPRPPQDEVAISAPEADDQARLEREQNERAQEYARKVQEIAEAKADAKRVIPKTSKDPNKQQAAERTAQRIKASLKPLETELEDLKKVTFQLNCPEIQVRMKKKLWLGWINKLKMPYLKIFDRMFSKI